MAAHNCIGLIGAGLLGTAIAERLLQAGYGLVVHDVNADRSAMMKELGAESVGCAADVTKECRRTILCLPDSNVVDRVLTSVLPALKPGSFILDTTTGDPVVEAEWGTRLAERHVSLIDATVLGSSQQMRDGEAVMILGGDDASMEKCRDIIEALVPLSFPVGACGSAQSMKLVVNLVLGLNRAALAEGLHFARSQGLDIARTLEILRSGAAYSRIMDTKGEKMIRENFQAQARLSQHLKDVELMLTVAERAVVELPISTIHRDLLKHADNLGFGQLDNSAIVKAWDSFRTRKSYQTMDDAPTQQDERTVTTDNERR